MGGGGSILTVPALVYILGQDPRTATTSSLFIVGVSSLIALIPHGRGGRVRFGQGLVFGILGTAGSVVGTAASSRVRPEILLAGFAALLLVVAVVMLRRSSPRKGPDDEADSPDEDESSRRPLLTLRPWSCDYAQVAKLLAAVTVVGAMTGFFGVGGGFVIVPALVLALRFPMPVAVGTSLLVITVNSATALVSRFFGPSASSGGAALDWPLIGVFTAAAVLGSLVGGRITARADPRRLTRAFAVLLLAVALYTAARSIPAFF